jgi:plastocyanin
MRRLLMAAVAAGAALTLAACSGATPAPAAPSTSSSSATTSASSTASSPSASPTTSSPTSSGRTLDITVSGRTVTPAPAQVDLPVGQTLTLVVTSDHDDELHAHGFDVEVPLKAGVPASITLTGKDAGVFEVETHEPALTLLTVAVR